MGGKYCRRDSQCDKSAIMNRLIARRPKMQAENTLHMTDCHGMLLRLHDRVYLCRGRPSKRNEIHTIVGFRNENNLVVTRAENNKFHGYPGELPSDLKKVRKLCVRRPKNHEK